MSEHEGGRIFFSNVRRSLEVEDEIRLVTVGVDIGSSTTHLVFSRLLLERLDNRYVVAEREVTHQSDVMLTPYVDAETLDGAALRAFFESQYAQAGVQPEQIDTGALIMTGVALRRRNARMIADVFAKLAGRFVAVSAGDALESRLAAFGSGAAARSIRDGRRVMNIDIGGGTCKIAVCEDGDVQALTAIDVGARILAFDTEGRIVRIEEAARLLAREADLSLALGEVPDPAGLRRMIDLMADHLLAALQGGEPAPGTAKLLRLEPLGAGPRPDAVSFSGGVAEYVYGWESRDHGDLGFALAQAVRRRVERWGPEIELAEQGIRATVVGASQYTVQVSGSTILVEPPSALPLRNLPVLTPRLPLQPDELVAEDITAAVRESLQQLDGLTERQPAALFYRWEGSATFRRLDAFCRGVAQGLAPLTDAGLPVVLIGEGDVGGLVGIHARSELRLPCAVVSIDGITLRAFDFIDIGVLLDTSGAVPVVVKSLVFPVTAALGRSSIRP